MDVLAIKDRRLLKDKIMKMQCLRKFCLHLAVYLTVFVFSQAVFAETITATRVFSTQAAGNRIDRPHINASDGDKETQWYTIDAGNYFGNGYPSASLILDLGADCVLEDFDFTAMTKHGNTPKDFTLNFATSAQGKLGFSDANALSYVMDATTGLTSESFASPITARYVELVVTSNYQGVHVGGDRVTFNDLSFTGTKGTPAPGPITPTANAEYDFLIQPTNAIEVNNDGKAAFTANNLSYLYDGALDTPTTTSWYTTALSGDYFERSVSPIVQFDLGEEFNLSGLSVWGYGSNVNLLREFSLNFYDSDRNLLDSGFDFLITDYIQPDEHADFSFDSVSGVQYVEMLMSDNFLGAAGHLGGDRVGFTGVRFHGSNAATPEPATWVMMALGLLAGAVVYRRKRQ